MKVHFLMKKVASTVGTRGFFLVYVGELRFVGRRPKTRAAKPREKTSGTQGKWHLNRQEKI